MDFVVIVSALIAVSGTLGAVLLGYRLGSRDARRRDLHEAYRSWVESLRAAVRERGALVTYDHIEAIKRQHSRASGIAPSPSGRTRAEHVRDTLAAEARLRSSETNLVLLESWDQYALRVRDLTAFVLTKYTSATTDAYGPMFESIGVEKVVTEALVDLEHKLRREHPVLKSRANGRVRPMAA